MKKLALVLSGGGFNGAFQIAALHYLKENWSKFDLDTESMDSGCVAGISVGSLGGSLIASHQFEKLRTIWEKVRKNGVEEIYTSDFIDTRSDSENVVFKVDPAFLFETFLPEFRPDLSVWQILPLLFSKRKQGDFLHKTLRQATDEFTANFNQFKALADNGSLEKKLKSLLKREPVKSSTFRCGFVSLNDGKYYSIKAEEFSSDDDFQKGVLPSSAISIIWAPVPEVQTTNDPLRQLVDGGIKNVSPLGDVLEDIHNDPDHDYTLLILNCNTHDPIPENYENRNIAPIALRALTDISLSGIFNNKIHKYLILNDILQQLRGSREHTLTPF